MQGDDDVDPKTMIGKKTHRLQQEMDAIRAVLRNSTWLSKNTEGLLPMDTSPLLPTYKTRTTWSKIVEETRKAFTLNKLADMPAPDTEPDNDFKTCNTIKILPADYFNPKSNIDVSTNQEYINDVCKDFTLNTKQIRVFMIVASHASGPKGRAPLPMYLGGMGGIGKSQVIDAIISFFEKRK